MERAVHHPHVDLSHLLVLNTQSILQQVYKRPSTFCVVPCRTQTSNLCNELGDGDGWLYVVDVVCCLDHALISPFTTSASTSSTAEVRGAGLFLPSHCAVFSLLVQLALYLAAETRGLAFTVPR